MSAQAALDAPRFNWLEGQQFALESSFPERIVQALRAKGHDLLPASEAAKKHYGGGQAIVRDPDTGVYIGGSEPRNGPLPNLPPRGKGHYLPSSG